MARVEDVPSDEEDEPEVIIEDDATEQEEIDNESEASDISETEEAERLLEDKVAELEEQILKDPYSYDQHIQLIEILDKLSDLERLRAAFKRLESDFPLQPEHWLLWTQTEASVAHTQEDRRAVHEMYKRAAAQVYSVPLYLQWLMFSMSDNVEEARATMEVIKRRAGYDPVASTDIWRAIVEYEKLNLSELSEEDSAAYTEQVIRVASCLAEQLTRPLLESEAALLELKQLHARHEDCLRSLLDQTLKQHEDIKDIREKVSIFEDRLLVAGLDEKLDVYKEYIGTLRQLHEDQGSEDTPFNCLEMCAALYDRATYECLSCDKVDALFKEYARMSPLLSMETAACSLEVCVTRRPLVAEYWVLTMHHLERHGRPFEEITSTLERGLLAGGQMSPAQGLALWLGYLECLRRQTDWKVEEQKQNLRKNLEYATEALYKTYGEEADPDCTLALLWARLEYTRLGDPVRGKEIFEKMFENSYNKCQSRLWLQLLELEQWREPRRSDNKIREQFRRAVRCTTDYPPAVCERWLAFEREYGTLDSLIHCRDTIEDALEQWRKSYDTQKEAKQNSKKAKNKNRKSENTDKKLSHTEAKTDGRARGKKRSAEDESKTDGVKKKKEEVKQNGVKRGHDNGVDEAVESKRQRVSADEANDDKTSVSSYDHSEHATPDKEACTLFVSNLDFKFDETALREALSAWGKIVSLRTVRGVKAFGGSICYCEYTSPESVDEAVKHDRFPLDGRPVFLSRYRANKAKETKFRYSTRVERNKLFVKNLPFSCCTEERLREVFGKCEGLKDVRVVTRKDGKPKGLAYIEYADDKSAAAALQATDNLLLEDRHIQVALSAPPPKDIPTASTSLGQGRRDTTAPRRTQLSSFVPRVLQKPTAVPVSSSSSPAASSTSMSNSDFRNMLLTKK